MRLGLLGAGSIGSFLLKNIFNGTLANFKVASVVDKNQNAPGIKLAKQNNIFCSKDVGSFREQDLDIIVEAASQEAVKEYGLFLIDYTKTILFMSVGALLDDRFYAKLFKKVQEQGKTIYIPSGAIGGLDVIKAAKLKDNLEKIELITRKPPKSLEGAPYLVERGITLKALKRAELLFEGPADLAVRYFPQNVNIAATLSLVGLGAKKTLVKVVADPALSKNAHEIYASGGFGELKITLSNNPMQENPKTSLLAALSLIAKLKSKSDTVQIG